jgi:hypothetical protein
VPPFVFLPLLKKGRSLMIFNLYLDKIKANLRDKAFYADVCDAASAYLRGTLDLDDAIKAVLTTLVDGK